MYLILAVLMFIYVCFIIAVIRNDLEYAYALIQRRFFPNAVIKRGGIPLPLVAAAAAEGAEGEAAAQQPMSLEEAFDQPDVGSPAWIAAERHAGCEGADADAADPSAAASPSDGSTLLGDGVRLRSDDVIVAGGNFVGDDLSTPLSPVSGEEELARLAAAAGRAGRQHARDHNGRMATNAHGHGNTGGGHDPPFGDKEPSSRR